MKTIELIVLIILAGSPMVLSQGESLFNDAFLHEIHITNMDTTLIDGSKVYQMVDITVDGVTVDSIGIKEKGNISRFVPHLKVPFKIKTNKYLPGRKIDGIKEFMLHNNFQDPTMMREKITYDICEQMGLLALRTAYAKVYINGEYWGLYTIVEGKDEMFKLVFDNRDADAIESLDFGDMCYISDNPFDYSFEETGFPYYQLENGDKTTAFERFSIMIDKANNTPDNQYLDIVPDYINLLDFFKYQAINVYLMNMDSYIAFRGNQIFMFDEGENLFQVIPWDFNASLGLWNTNNASPDSYPILPSVISTGCIASKINNIPVLKLYYLDAMCLLNNEFCEPDKMNEIIDGWKDQIKQAVYDDSRKTFSNEDFNQSLETGYFLYNSENVPGLKTFFSERFSVISQGLAELNYSCAVTSTSELIDNIRITIFPNPASKSFHIDTDLNIDEVIIYNTLGQKVEVIEFHNQEIDVEHLMQGIYIILLNHSGRMKSYKLIVK